MYLLLDGEVTLSINKKVIGTVGKGEIFGEMASISHLPRSATAVAKTACSVMALDEKQFQNAIEKSPEFALMLMSIIISRLRETVSNLTSGGRLSDKDRWNRAAVFDRKLMADLEREFEDKPPSLHPLNKVIVKEGDKGDVHVRGAGRRGRDVHQREGGRENRPRRRLRRDGARGPVRARRHRHRRDRLHACSRSTATIS